MSEEVWDPSWDEDNGLEDRKPEPHRPKLDDESEEIRTMWIAAVNNYHSLRGARIGTYNSKPIWDGGYDARVRRTYRKPAWPGIAKKVKDSGVTTLDLIRSLFGRWAEDSVPTPYALVSEENVRIAIRDRNARRRRLCDALRSQEAVFLSDLWGASETIPNPRDAASFVLNDTALALTPLFRYSIAVLKGLDRVASQWEAAATAQFRSDPAPYTELWGHILPDKLKAEPAKA